MKKQQVLSCLAVGIMAALSQSSAFAVNNYSAADDFIYFGTKVGYSYMPDACSSNYKDCDDNNVGYGIFLGYQYTSWLGFEIDAINYGEYEALYQNSIAEAEVVGYGASVKLSQSVWDSTEAYFRAGAAYMDISNNSPYLLAGKNGWSPLAAIGLEYLLTKSLTLRTEYQYSNDVGGSDNHLASIALSYRFGQAKPIPFIKPTPKTVVEPVIEPEPVVEPEPVLEEPKEFVLKEAVQEENAEVIFTSEALYFDTNSSFLNADAKKELQRVAEFAKQHSDVKVWLEGYTDTTGTAQYNLWLSHRRANSAGSYLDKLGVKEIYMKGKGEASLDPATEDADARKVVVIITRNNESLDNW